MQNASAMKTARRKTSSAPMPAAQEPDPLTENLMLLDSLMLQARENVAVDLVCLLAGFEQDPESLPPTIAYLQSRYLS